MKGEPFLLLRSIRGCLVMEEYGKVFNPHTVHSKTKIRAYYPSLKKYKKPNAIHAIL